MKYSICWARFNYITPHPQTSLGQKNNSIIYLCAGCKRFIKTARLWCWRKASTVDEGELKVAVKAPSINSSIKVKRGRAVKVGGGWRVKIIACYHPLLMITAWASYLQLVGGRGRGYFLIKSCLFYIAQEVLITLYVGALDCLIISTFWPRTLPINSCEHHQPASPISSIDSRQSQ